MSVSLDVRKLGRNGGCESDGDCIVLARCLRRLPGASGPPLSAAEIAADALDALNIGVNVVAPNSGSASELPNKSGHFSVSPTDTGPGFRIAPSCRCVRPRSDNAPPPPTLPAPGSAPGAPPPRAVAKGRCVAGRPLGHPCKEDIECAPGMVCSFPSAICACADGLRYSRLLARCVPDPAALRRHQWHEGSMDQVAIADMDGDLPEKIPATYDCPLLVGMISAALVVICLVVAAYCRFTDPPPRPPGYRPARTERDESDSYEWCSVTTPLRSSWDDTSDLSSSFRRVKYCTCSPAAQTRQAESQLPNSPFPSETVNPSSRSPRSSRPVGPPQLPKTPSLYMAPGFQNTVLRMPCLPSLEGSIVTHLQQLPVFGELR